MSTPLQTLHSREEEGEKAKHCQQKLQENVWKVNFSSNVKQTETDKKKKQFSPQNCQNCQQVLPNLAKHEETKIL